MEIARVNFGPLGEGGDNGTAALVKLDANCQELADAIGGNGDGIGSLSDRVDDVEDRVTTAESQLAGLKGASKLDVGTTAGTVAAGNDPRLAARGLRNLLINGDLRINQPVFAGGALAANAYGYDMWRTFGAAASLTRSADRKSITLNGTVGTILEAPDLAGATVTVSVRNPTGAITVNLRPDATTAGVNGVIPAGADVQSVTLVIPASITGNVFMQLTTAAAVTFDGSAKQGGIQMELGSFASYFEHRDLSFELARSQRYYEKSYDADVAPGTATTVGIVQFRADGFSSGTHSSVLLCAMRTTKRGTPAISPYSPVTGAIGMTRDFTNGADNSAIIQNVGTNAFGVAFVTATANAGVNQGCHWVADARI